MKLHQLIQISLLACALSACGGNEQTSTTSNILMAAAPAMAPANTEATFSEARNQYAISYLADGFQVKHLRSGEVRQLSGTSAMRFSDVRVVPQIANNARTIAAADLKLLIELYLAFLNRTPDADGLSYWIDEFRRGKDLSAIADVFYQAAKENAAMTGYSANMNNEDFVRLIYKNVLARTGDLVAQVDVNYWVNELASGRASRGALVKAMLDASHGLKGDARWGPMADLLDNKYQFAYFMAVEQGISYLSTEQAYQQGTTLLALVTSNSIAAAVEKSGLGTDQFNLLKKPAGLYLVYGEKHPGGANFVDGKPAQSRFSSPGAMASDANGNRYVLDQLIAQTSNYEGPYYAAIRKISTDYVTTTLLMNRELANALAVDRQGALYFIENNAIKKIDSLGHETLLFSPVSNKTKLSFDQQDILYFTYYGYVLSLSADGKLNLPFSNQTVGVNEYGIHNMALPVFNVGQSQQVYFTDFPSGNQFPENLEFRRMTIAGQESLTIKDQQGIRIPASDLWSAPVVNNTELAFVTARGIYTMNPQTSTSTEVQAQLVYDFAKQPITNFSRSITSPYANGYLNFAMLWDSLGNFTLNDSANHTLVNVSRDGTTTALAGRPEEKDGLPNNMVFGYKSGPESQLSAIDTLGNYYVLENALISTPEGGTWTANRLIKVAAQGTMTVLAEPGKWWGRADTKNIASQFPNPQALVLDTQGNMFVATVNKIMKINPLGEVSDFAGSARAESIDGIGKNAGFKKILGMTIDTKGQLIVADAGTVRVVSPTAEVKTTTAQANWFLSLGAEGKFYSVTVADPNYPYVLPDAIQVSENIGAQNSVTMLKRFPVGQRVTSMVADSRGNVYWTIVNVNAIYKLSPQGDTSIVAGGLDPQVATEMRIKNPTGLVLKDDKTLLFISGHSLFQLVLP